MSPRVRVGDTVELDQSLTACPGDGVLVRDSAGALYLRRYRETGAATWEAYPLNEAYRTLRSDADGLTVVAVVVGIPRQRWT